MTKLLIISFCSFDYRELALIWVSKLQNINVSNYIIIATDEKTYRFLVKHKVNTKLCVKNVSDTFWIYRMNVLHTFFMEKFDIIHSDLDAIWRKNIVPLLNDANIDMYFSQGTICPEEHLKKHNFVLCCGFFYLRHNTKTLEFMKKYLIVLNKMKDDQRAINKVLLDTIWKYEGRSFITHVKNYKYFHEDIIGFNNTYNLNICLISMFKIQRIYLNNEYYISHILTPKVCSEKISKFKSLNII